MLKTLKNLFFDEEEVVVSTSPSQFAAGRLDKEIFRARLRSEIIIDFVDQDKLFHDYLIPSVLIQFQKDHYQEIFYIDSIEESLRFDVMNQLNELYGTKQDIDIERIKSRFVDAFGVRLHNDEYATRASIHDKSPCHVKMTRLVAHVRNGGIIERPIIKKPEILPGWESMRAYFYDDAETLTETQPQPETAASRKTPSSLDEIENFREYLDKHRCGKKRDAGGNDDAGGFHPI